MPDHPYGGGGVDELNVKWHEANVNVGENGYVNGYVDEDAMNVVTVVSAAAIGYNHS